MAIRRTIESVFSVLKYYGIENILARSIVGFQQTVELIVLMLISHKLLLKVLYYLIYQPFRGFR
ncbi:MAG: hypothetical protein DQL93_10870 [Lactobacillus delbrueckii subsp. lactis]|uniref:Transposase n=1 Tax=Lactobacillus delbrueckii subsp. lactis TaxID=29397 RepID=A0A3G6JFS0_LACDL|nr:MAG: hypothetical protein DQL93_10870 [Lactobacillus delbrueckii subsp. lactis]